MVVYCGLVFVRFFYCECLQDFVYNSLPRVFAFCSFIPHQALMAIEGALGRSIIYALIYWISIMV